MNQICIISIKLHAYFLISYAIDIVHARHVFKLFKVSKSWIKIILNRITM